MNINRFKSIWSSVAQVFSVPGSFEFQFLLMFHLSLSVWADKKLKTANRGPIPIIYASFIIKSIM